MSSSALDRSLGSTTGSAIPWVTNELGLAQDSVEIEDVIARDAAKLIILRTQTTDGEVRRVCVKQYHRLDDAPVEVLFDRAVALSDALEAASLKAPAPLAVSKDLAAIAMTVVEGQTLESLIRKAISRGPSDLSVCLDQVREAARAIARLHSIPVPIGAPTPQPCSNAEYVERLARQSTTPFIDKCLTNSVGSLEALLRSLPPDFWSRHEKRLLHGDCQAKNFLISSTDELILIDLSYGRGHPLHDVAHFIVQLERLFWRHPTPRTKSIIQRIKSSFLDTYTSSGYDYLKSDMPFFRVWATTFALVHDTERPRLEQRYIELMHRVFSSKK